MKHVLKQVKRTAAAIAVAAVMVTAGLGSEAQALEYTNGDLVFAMYKNGTEYLRNLGQASSLFSGGPSTVINILPADVSTVSGTNTVKWALYGFDAVGSPPSIFASSSKALADYSTTELNSVSVSTMINSVIQQSSQMAGDGNIGIHILPASNPNSFTNTFIPTESLAGSFPVSTEGTFGSLLHLLQGNFDTNGLSTIGHAILSANGSQLTINQGVPAAVPIPAALILFGSGLIGLVGIARRTMMRS